MKRIICVLFCAAFLMVSGCGDGHMSPEDFGKNYVEKKFEGLSCDLEDLDYTVTEDGEDKATIEIQGEIKYKEKISIVKKDKKWILTPEVSEQIKTKTKKKAAMGKKAQQ